MQYTSRGMRRRRPHAGRFSEVAGVLGLGVLECGRTDIVAATKEHIMAESTTLNVRMDAETKDAFTSFCDAIGMSASSLMNVFAKTVVRNQEVPFPLTTRPAAAVRYARVFPRDAEELEAMLAASEATPLSDCAPMADGAALVRERMGW